MKHNVDKLLVEIYVSVTSTTNYHYLMALIQLMVITHISFHMSNMAWKLQKEPPTNFSESLALEI